MPRDNWAPQSIQLVSRGRITWTKKAMWLRNRPYTADNPTPAQASVRIALAEVGKEYARLSPEEKARIRAQTGLPGAAGYVKQNVGRLHERIMAVREAMRRRGIVVAPKEKIGRSKYEELMKKFGLTE